MTTVQFQTSTPRKPGGFADLFEQSVAKADTLKEGDIVSGTVIAVGKDHVVVDIGYKSEGVIRVDEFAEP
jgi:small subunit ribosomal protein S1